MGRESFKSRLGFILVSAGCAIGIGNVGDFRMWQDRMAEEFLYCFI